MFAKGYLFNFKPTTDGLNATNRDFLTVATHELGHAIGLGTSDTYFRQILDYSIRGIGKLYFTGRNAMSAYFNMPVPLSYSDGQVHWGEEVLGDYGIKPSLARAIGRNERHLFSELDHLAVLDLGFTARREDQVGGANDTITTAQHVLTYLPGRGGARSVTLRRGFDRPRDVDVYRVHASAGNLLEIYDRTGTEETIIDPTIRVYDLVGYLLGTHAGRGATAGERGLEPLLRLAIGRDDYYYVAVSAPGNVDYNPFQAESVAATAVGEYAISISLHTPSAPLG
ncbi:MAG: repeat protein [Planctomycetota bacterium]|nr:repeat protein [Planctomycetota bacterium]